MEAGRGFGQGGKAVIKALVCASPVALIPIPTSAVGHSDGFEGEVGLGPAVHATAAVNTVRETVISVRAVSGRTSQNRGRRRLQRNRIRSHPNYRT